MDVTGDRSKVRCCKEKYCIGTWDVRSMNPGKLEVAKQMTRVNVNIRGISKLKWTGMGDFNSDDHYVYYCGQESLRRNGINIMVTKGSKMQNLDAISEMTEDIKKKQEYTEKLYKKDLHNQGNDDGVITHLEPVILDVKSSGP